MAMREQMMAERHAAQVRLQGLLDQVSSAEGDARIDAMSALLTELTEQQLAHMQHMEQMMGMMEQMSGGRMGGRDAPPEPQRYVACCRTLDQQVWIPLENRRHILIG